jgi:hypothetical protein
MTDRQIDVINRHANLEFGSCYTQLFLHAHFLSYIYRTFIDLKKVEESGDYY